MSAESKMKIVIVGGGGAGAICARSLSAKLDPKYHNITLINPLPYYVFYPAAARLVVSRKDRLEDTALIPYDKLFYKGNGTFVLGTVVSISDDDKSGHHVMLESGERVDYDILLLSPGCSWEGPLAFPQNAEEILPFIEHWRQTFEDARHVALIGGGGVGIGTRYAMVLSAMVNEHGYAELAGEIWDTWPDKKVTIIQGRGHLMTTTYPDKFRQSLERRVRARGINVVLNDYVDDMPKPGVTGVTTRSGKTIDADLVVTSRGSRPNTGFIASLGPDSLTQRGFVKVTPTFQLPHHDNIFAGGDVVDIAEGKQITTAARHGQLIASNIVAYIRGRPLAKYNGSLEGIIITLGRTGGAGYIGILWGILIGDFLTRLFRARTLAIKAGRRAFGY